MNNKNYYKLGINIYTLRKAYKKTQLEMANDLNIKDNTISQYENGVQIPERDILLKIAKYFKVTENELIYGDFSSYEKINFSKITNETINRKVFESMFPIISCKKALKNNKFKEAYEINLKVFKDFLDGKVEEETVNKAYKMIEIYNQAYKQGVVEGIANILCWDMLEGYLMWMYNPYYEDMIDIFSSFNEKQLIDLFALNLQSEEYFEKNKEYEKERIQYIKETEKNFYKNVAILKYSKDYADLADYYISFRYMLGLYDNLLTFEMNRTIGIEIANLFDILGNKYIKKIKSVYGD